LKKNIIHIFWSFTKGGSEYLVKEITENSPSSISHSVIVINNHFDINLINAFDKNIKFSIINRQPKTYNLSWVIKFINSIISVPNRVIHCHNYSLIYLVWIFFKTPKFLTIHGFDNRLKKYGLFDEIICVSQPLSNYVENTFFLKTRTILNGVDNKMIKTKNNFNDKIKLLFVGRFDDYTKGVDVLIKAINILVSSGNDIHLTIIGKGTKQAEFIDFIELNGLKQHISFKGLVPRNILYNLLCDYDVSVIPSRKESFSLFAVESMMAKVPIIVSDVPGLSEISGDHSFKFESENIDHLYSCILKVVTEIKNNKILQRTNASYNYAISNYTLEQMLENYYELYNSL
jgi:glycosyltransferase involved in cell wall biosynthesis